MHEDFETVEALGEYRLDANKILKCVHRSTFGSPETDFGAFCWSDRYPLVGCDPETVVRQDIAEEDGSGGKLHKRDDAHC